MTWQNQKEAIFIPLPEAFDMETNLAYLTRDLNECMYTVHRDTITKAIQIGGVRSLVQISVANHKHMIVQPLGPSSALGKSEQEALVAYIREWFDLDNDLTAFYEMASADPLLRLPVEQFYGLRLIGIPDLFEALCWGVLGQQINLAFAYVLKRRFVEQFGDYLENNGMKHWIFPSCERIAQLTPADLSLVKMTVKKSEYIIGVAKLMASGELTKEKLIRLPFKKAEQKLLKIRGIGPWTANYVLMRCLRFGSSFPIDDVGLMNSIKTLHGMDRKPTKNEMLEFALPWKNWEAYATFYLWRYLY